MQLPTQIPFALLLTKWSAILNPVIASPMVGVSILKDISLTDTAYNQIPHLLGQMQSGWFIVDQNAAASIFRSKPFNSNYLYLNSSAAVTVSIGVF